MCALHAVRACVHACARARTNGRLVWLNVRQGRARPRDVLATARATEFRSNFLHESAAPMHARRHMRMAVAAHATRASVHRVRDTSAAPEWRRLVWDGTYDGLPGAALGEVRPAPAAPAPPTVAMLRVLQQRAREQHMCALPRRSVARARARAWARYALARAARARSWTAREYVPPVRCTPPPLAVVRACRLRVRMRARRTHCAWSRVWRRSAAAFLLIHSRVAMSGGVHSFLFVSVLGLAYLFGHLFSVQPATTALPILRRLQRTAAPAVYNLTIALGYNVCLDGIVRWEDVVTKHAMTPPGDRVVLTSDADVSAAFAHYFTAGAAAERTCDPIVFAQLVERAK
ncbi:hypothetical protein EON67_02635, partial [archaeon]